MHQIETMRREHKWSASRIAFELSETGTMISRRTVTRLLARLGLNRRWFIDRDGDANRQPKVIVAKRPGHMVHVDVKKVGRIPDGGGWRAHGRDSEQARRRGTIQDQDRQARVRLPALRCRRSHPDGLHRTTTGREGSNRSRVRAPFQGLIRRARHRPYREDRHRQWSLLPRRRLRQVTARRGGKIQPNLVGRVPLLAHLGQRGRTISSGRDLERALQPSPTAQHRSRSTLPLLVPRLA